MASRPEAPIIPYPPCIVNPKELCPSRCPLFPVNRMSQMAAMESQKIGPDELQRRMVLERSDPVENAMVLRELSNAGFREMCRPDRMTLTTTSTGEILM